MRFLCASYSTCEIVLLVGLSDFDLLGVKSRDLARELPEDVVLLVPLFFLILAFELLEF